MKLLLLKVRREYLVNRFCIVSIYWLPLRVRENDRIMFKETLSNAAPGVSVISIGCLISCR